jgi:hypothetical protein
MFIETGAFNLRIVAFPNYVSQSYALKNSDKGAISAIT